MSELKDNPVDCFTCDYWGGTGCSLTACCMIKHYIYLEGKLVEVYRN